MDPFESRRSALGRDRRLGFAARIGGFTLSSVSPISGYTIKKFDAIGNANSDPASPVDARLARKHLESEHLGVTRMRYEPDVHLPIGHSHREQEEVYVGLSGSGRVKLDDDVHDIGPWDLIRVAPSTMRGFASGPDGLELLAIGSDRPEGGDGELHRGWWTD